MRHTLVSDPGLEDYVVRDRFADWLVDPRDGGPLDLRVTVRDEAGEVSDGTLTAGDGTAYEIRDGIPRFVSFVDAGQRQTADSFGFKWAGWQDVQTADSLDTIKTWLVQRYFEGDASAMTAFFSKRERVLDSGCGSGMSSLIYLAGGFNGELWVGADISPAVDIARRNLGSLPETNFVQADMLALPFRRATFDTIFAEGTMHHTPSTRTALKSLVQHLEVGGYFLFYVYARKGPVREFVDDYVRELICDLPPVEAAQALQPLTELGRALADLHQEITVPDVPILGIEAGTYDLQRFFYWNIAKVFWNDVMTFEENNHVNFDWYHPRYAHRQSEAEVREWCDEAGLVIDRVTREEAGLTVRARRER